MNKEELDFNLNSSPIKKGIALGAGGSAILTTIPFVVTHPKAQYILLSLLSVGLSVEVYKRLKSQINKNEELIKKYKIKDYKNPAAWATNCGLFGLSTFSFLPSATTDPNFFNIIVVLLSAGLLIPSIINLRQDVMHNIQQINKTK